MGSRNQKMVRFQGYFYSRMTALEMSASGMIGRRTRVSVRESLSGRAGDRLISSSAPPAGDNSGSRRRPNDI